MIQKGDNRRHPRVKLPPEAPEVQIHLITMSGVSDTRHVRAVDLSNMGLSFREAGAVPVGTRCTILINHRQQPMRIVGQVVNCHPAPAPEKGFVVGVKFMSLCPISTEGLGTPLTDDPAVQRLMVDMQKDNP